MGYSDRQFNRGEQWLAAQSENIQMDLSWCLNSPQRDELLQAIGRLALDRDSLIEERNKSTVRPSPAYTFTDGMGWTQSIPEGYHDMGSG